MAPPGPAHIARVRHLYFERSVGVARPAETFRRIDGRPKVSERGDAGTPAAEEWARARSPYYGRAECRGHGPNRRG